VLGFMLGWLAAGAAARDLSLLTLPALAGMLGTVLVVGGLYIVTQSYQAAEDRARGDLTLPVLLGPRHALLVALALLGVGGLVLLLQLGPLLGPVLTGVTALFLLALGGWLLRWALTFDEERVRSTYLTAMRLTAVASGGLTLLLLSQFPG
jgi:4-hydroxybenzoate polyprenyltransferase